MHIDVAPTNGRLVDFYPPRLLFSRSAFLNLTLSLFSLSVALSFKSYCPMRAALTFVGCDKSKQKRAFGPSRRSAVAVNFSASSAFITVNTSPLIPPP